MQDIYWQVYHVLTAETSQQRLLSQNNKYVAMLVWFLPRATLSVTVQGTAAWHPFIFPVWPTKPSLCRWWQRASCAPVYCSMPRPAALSAAGIRPTAWQKRGARKTSLPPTVWALFEETGNHKQLRADESHRHLLVATLKDSRTKKLDTWKKLDPQPVSVHNLLWSCWAADLQQPRLMWYFMGSC